MVERNPKYLPKDELQLDLLFELKPANNTETGKLVIIRLTQVQDHLSPDVIRRVMDTMLKMKWLVDSKGNRRLPFETRAVHARYARRKYELLF
ncbi:hypothetical protein ACJQWY_04745 [Weissella kandleri]|uniref:hypothetical protein n=1 Tax=Weissella kandleri TaxID=1616 RepID=UPI00387E4583